MSNDTRNRLIKSLVFLFVLFLATGLIGYFFHKLDWPSTWLLIGVFTTGSLVVSILAIVDSRQTQARESAIAESLAPFSITLQRCKDGSYELITDPFYFDRVEPMDLDGVEAWLSGLRAGLELGRSEAYNEDMEARLARQAAQHEEDRAHIGTFGQYIPSEDIPGYGVIYEEVAPDDTPQPPY